MTSKPFKSDIANIKRHARTHVLRGAVTEAYKGDRKVIIEALNGALATEIVCVLRYKFHYFMAKGIHANEVRAEFLEHAEQELAHADLLAERITQLDGIPNFSPDGLATRSHADYVDCRDISGMLTENLIAERIAIDSYRELISYIGNDDPTTKRMLETILAQEEEHADDLGTLLDDLGDKHEPTGPALHAVTSRRSDTNGAREKAKHGK